MRDVIFIFFQETLNIQSDMPATSIHSGLLTRRVCNSHFNPLYWKHLQFTSQWRIRAELENFIRAKCIEISSHSHQNRHWRTKISFIIMIVGLAEQSSHFSPVLGVGKHNRTLMLKNTPSNFVAVRIKLNVHIRLMISDAVSPRGLTSEPLLKPIGRLHLSRVKITSFSNSQNIMLSMSLLNCSDNV